VPDLTWPKNQQAWSSHSQGAFRGPNYKYSSNPTTIFEHE